MSVTVDGWLRLGIAATGFAIAWALYAHADPVKWVAVVLSVVLTAVQLRPPGHH